MVIQTTGPGGQLQGSVSPTTPSVSLWPSDLNSLKPQRPHLMVVRLNEDKANAGPCARTDTSKCMLSVSGPSVALAPALKISWKQEMKDSNLARNKEKDI